MTSETELNNGLIPLEREDYFVKKIIDLARTYQKLEKNKPYVQIPLRDNEWELIIKKLKTTLHSKGISQS